MLPVPIGQSINSNFEADVLETHSHWAFFAYDFRDQHIRIDKNGQVAFKVPEVGSIGLLVKIRLKEPL